jgi:hypothetical protein
MGSLYAPRTPTQNRQHGVGQQRLTYISAKHVSGFLPHLVYRATHVGTGARSAVSGDRASLMVGVSRVARDFAG